MDFEDKSKADEFETLDITKLTSKDRIMKIVKSPQRPGKACEMTSGLIHEDELPHLAKELDLSIEQLKENLLDVHNYYNKNMHKPKLDKHPEKEHLPYGKCVFLHKSDDSHNCRFGDKKPLHCKLSTDKKHGHKIHNWYLLNHVVDIEDPESIRQWASYLKSHPTIPGGKLNDLVPNKEKLEQILKYELVHKKLD